MADTITLNITDTQNNFTVSINPLGQIGLPPGGSIGQFLTKKSDLDFDAGWATGSGGGGVPEAPIDGNLYGRKDADWFVVPSGVGGSAVWGTITGTLSSQIDLQSALNVKVNSSSLAMVAMTGNYTDLIDRPTIPAAQVNSDWNSVSGVSQILNKPTIPIVPANGKGYAVIDFGAFPGKNSATVTITGLTTISNTDVPIANIVSGEYGVFTSDDIVLISSIIEVSCTVPIAGTGFTISAKSVEKLQGQIQIAWKF